MLHIPNANVVHFHKRTRGQRGSVIHSANDIKRRVGVKVDLPI